MGLKKAIGRRVLLAIPTAIGVVTLIFVVISAMTPTMRVAYFVGDQPRDFTPENLQRVIHMYGLDRSIFEQYIDWLRKVVSLDFGRSMSSGLPAMSVVFTSLPPTLELMMYSAPFILWFGIWLGTKSALNHNRTVDHLARIIGTVGTTFPVFFLSTLVISVAAAQLRYIPLGRLSYWVQINLNTRILNGTYTQYTNMITVDALLNGDIPLFLDAITHLIPPVVILVFTQSAALMRVTRSGLIEAYDKPYCLSALAKGLSKKQVIYRHARKNALVSVLTLSGLLLGNMLVGLVIVETIFNIPGFGFLTAYSARTIDTPVVFASALFVALFFVLLNLVVDILYGYIDQRIKLL